MGLYDDNSWAGYMGGILRGEQPINQLMPTHPYIDDIPALEEYFIKNKQYFMLLTLNEAKGVLSDLLGETDDFLSYKLGGGNIKDIWDCAHTFSNFTTYINESDSLVFNLKGLGIKAIPYVINGVSYIKITGYASLRRILKGTRYRANNMQLLELGIGWRGMAFGITKGFKFCVYFSMAFRAIELMFKEEYSLIDFFGDIVMDAAKTIVASVVVFVIGVVVGISFPVIYALGMVIIIGVILNAGLNYLDSYFGISGALKKKLQDAFNEQEKIHAWHMRNVGRELLPLYFIHN